MSSKCLIKQRPFELHKYNRIISDEDFHGIKSSEELSQIFQKVWNLQCRRGDIVLVNLRCTDSPTSKRLGSSWNLFVRGLRLGSQCGGPGNREGLQNDGKLPGQRRGGYPTNHLFQP